MRRPRDRRVQNDVLRAVMGDWSDWHEQLKHALSTMEEVEQHCVLTESERRGFRHASRGGFPFQITPYYFSLIDPNDPEDPIRAQCFPVAAEADDETFISDDSLAEVRHTVAPLLIHRYPDRALLLATDRCAAYCRHCTRRRRVGRGAVHTQEDMELAFRWLEEHPHVPELILSGGDPLVASDRWIANLLNRIRQIRHIEIIRIGSRVPVTLPQRITKELCDLLKAFHPLYVLTQFNHPRELTAEAVAACTALADAGVVVANQTVLLRGVNDCARVQLDLCRTLLRTRVRPYYLMQCDAVRGTSHLRTSIRRGLSIMAVLRKHLSGLALPNYVLDLPGGYGKVLLTQRSLSTRKGEYVVLGGLRGQRALYPDTLEESSRCESCLCERTV